MKRILLIFMCMNFCVGFSGGVGGDNGYSAEITRNGFYPENMPSVTVVTTVAERKAFCPFEPYEKYDEKFFDKHNLVVALLERGSGSIKFSFEGAMRDSDGVLVVTVGRSMPMIQTLDYRTHVLLLPVEKSVTAGGVRVVTVDGGQVPWTVLDR